MDSKTETVSDREIAKFMNINVTSGFNMLWIVDEEGEMPDYKNGNVYSPSTNWNQLMPVVEKIENIIDIKVHETIQVNSTLDDPKGWRSWDYYRIELSTDIKSVYGEAVEFIRFYNSQSPDTIK